jgi:hypothetical protein
MTMVKKGHAENILKNQQEHAKRQGAKWYENTSRCPNSSLLGWDQ